jgi:murein DD-endopeptidase MepM/ murein hydrolase activator NlpD
MAKRKAKGLTEEDRTSQIAELKHRAHQLCLPILAAMTFLLADQKPVFGSCLTLDFSPKSNVSQEQHIKYDVVTPQQYEELREYLLKTNGRCTQRWGNYLPNKKLKLTEELHPGIDYGNSLNTTGNTIFSATDGKITKVQVGGDCQDKKECLSFVSVENPKTGKKFFYLHLVPSVTAGTPEEPVNVKAGDPIGTIGARGPGVIGPHLHFEVRDPSYTQPAANVRLTFNPYCSVIHAREGAITLPSWNFGVDGNLDCWELNNLESYSIQDGIFYLDLAFRDPYIISPPLSLDALDYETLEIRMASNAPDGAGAVYFSTAIDPGYSKNRKVSFAVTNDGNYHTYPIRLGDHKKWTGTITGIRIDPANNGRRERGDSSDTIGIDYIKLSTKNGPQPGPNVGDAVRLPMLSGDLTGVAVEAGGQTVLVAEESGELSRVDLTTGKVTTIAFVNSLGIASPAIEASETTALVIIAPGYGPANGGIARINLLTGEVQIITEHSLDRSRALAIEPSGRSALVTGGEGGLFRVDLETGAVSTVSGTGGSGLAIESSGTTALVATGIFGAGTFSCDLKRVDLTTGAATTVATISCIHRPMSVAIESSGTTALVTTNRNTTFESGEIYRVDLASGMKTFLTSCFRCHWPQIVMEPSGNSALFISNEDTSLIRFDTSSSTQTALAHADIPFGMALSPDGTTAFTVGSRGKVSRIALSTGKIERISEIFAAHDIAVDAGGTTAFITTGEGPGRGTIQEVDLEAGSLSLVASLSSQLTGIALESGGTSALVTAFDLNSLLRVDLTSGNASVLSDQLLRPRIVEIEQEGVSALVVDDSSNPRALLRVDLQTGVVTRLDPNLGISGMALESGNQSVLLAVGDALLRMDLTTRAVTTLASPVCGISNQFTGIIIEAGEETALLSHLFCGILRVRVK